jgi:molybdopterin/thiamine biosynthesis adenylyltransferase/rhodanese-related sulfurtransferase
MSVEAREGILSREELQRYSRHLILPEVGIAGQRKLRDARVLLVGAGGLGSPLGLYLAAAGIGSLGIVDDDVVDQTNLQRQVIHDSPAIGRPKTESAAARIAGLNPHVEVEQHRTRVVAGNVMDLVRAYDIVVDGSDNFSTRYCISDACVIAKRPNVYGSVYRFEGQASVFDAQRGPCYRCVFPTAPPPGEIPSCAEGGVLGVLPGIIGLIQATETIKLILGIGEPLIGRLLVFDALDMRFRTLKLLKDEHCPACGPNPTITEVRDETVSCEIPSAAGAGDTIDVETLHERLARGERVALLDVREPAELEIAKLDNTFEIPLDELDERLSELPADREIVVYCLTGNRSARAARLLQGAGYARVRNLEGGLRAWTDRIDPTLTRY